MNEEFYKALDLLQCTVEVLLHCVTDGIQLHSNIFLLHSG